MLKNSPVAFFTVKQQRCNAAMMFFIHEKKIISCAKQLVTRVHKGRNDKRSALKFFPLIEFLTSFQLIWNYFNQVSQKVN